MRPVVPEKDAKPEEWQIYQVNLSIYASENQIRQGHAKATAQLVGAIFKSLDKEGQEAVGELTAPKEIIAALAKVYSRPLGSTAQCRS